MDPLRFSEEDEDDLEEEDDDCYFLCVFEDFLFLGDLLCLH
jgi:hypothetical protein